MTNAQDLTPVQQSMTVNSRDYRHLNMDRDMLGVILSVYPADDGENNRTSQQQLDRRGFTQMCSVLIVNDGSGSYMKLQNVVIPPDMPSGLDNYYERLPRGSSKLVSGENFDPLLHQVDPYDLDGDWCIIRFLGGQLTSPYISRWWPHARNPYDPATSGKGQNGDTLKQSGRYFSRTNGVETLITSEGDIIISTTLAKSVINPSEQPALGRIARDTDTELGGSIKVIVKPTQSFELDFNPQDEGIGVLDAVNEEIPQTNPPQTQPQAQEKENSYLVINQYRALYVAPESVTMTLGTDFVVTADGSASISAEDVLTLEGSQILHGENAEDTEPLIKGGSFKDWLLQFTVDSPFGPLLATAAYVNTLTTSNAVSTKNFVE